MKLQKIHLCIANFISWIWHLCSSLSASLSASWFSSLPCNFSKCYKLTATKVLWKISFNKMLQVNSNKDQLISGVNSPIKNTDYCFNINRTDMTCVRSGISVHDFTNPDFLHFWMLPNIKYLVLNMCNMLAWQDYYGKDVSPKFYKLWLCRHHGVSFVHIVL